MEILTLSKYETREQTDTSTIYQGLCRRLERFVTKISENSLTGAFWASE